jgi:hypothetical protein
MDKSASQPGRDGRVSHRTYGSRGDEDPGTDPEKVVKPAKAKDVAKDAGKELEKAMDRAHKKGVAEGSEEKDPVWNKGTPMPKDYTCHCGIYVHPSVRNPKAIHTSDCPYAKKQGVAEGSEKHTQSRLWQMISDYEQRAKATKNDIKKAHYLKMAQELRYKLKTSDEEGVAEEQLDEINWRKGIATGAMALGAMGALGAGGASKAHAADLSGYNTQYLQSVASGQHPRPLVSVDDAKAELQARENGKQQRVSTTANSPSGSAGFSKDYLEKAADPNRVGRFLISVEKAQEQLNKMQESLNEFASHSGDGYDPMDNEENYRKELQALRILKNKIIDAKSEILFQQELDKREDKEDLLKFKNNTQNKNILRDMMNTCRRKVTDKLRVKFETAEQKLQEKFPEGYAAHKEKEQNEYRAMFGKGQMDFGRGDM